MQKINQIHEVVKKELESNYKARLSDSELILGVMTRMGVNTDESFSDLVKTKKLPSFESITRARRKVQADNPELKDARISELREEREIEFREFAREVNRA